MNKNYDTQYIKLKLNFYAIKHYIYITRIQVVILELDAKSNFDELLLHTKLL